MFSRLKYTLLSMGISEKCMLGSTEEILAEFSKRKLDIFDFNRIFYDAILEKNETVLSALLQYSNTDTSLVNQQRSYSARFSFRETKESIELLVKYMPAHILLRDVLGNLEAPKNTEPTEESATLQLQAEVITRYLDMGMDPSSLIIAEDTYTTVIMLSSHKELLLNHPTNPLSPEYFLKIALKNPCNGWDIAKASACDEIINYAISKGARLSMSDLSEDPYSHAFRALFRYAVREKDEKLLQESMKYDASIAGAGKVYFAFSSLSFDAIKASADFLAKHIPFRTILDVNFTYIKGIPESSDFTKEALALGLQGELINLALDNGVDPNKLLVQTNYLCSNECLLAHKEALLNHTTNSLLAVNLLLAAQRPNNPHDIKQTEVYEQIIDYAIAKGVDPNAPTEAYEGATMLEHFFIDGNFQVVDKLLTQDSTISATAWALAILDRPGIVSLVEALKRFPDSFLSESLYELARAHGVSHVEINAIIDVRDLALDYINNRTLSYEERVLLNKNSQILQVESYIEGYKHIKTLNKYGFTALQLALLGHKFELAIRMIEQGCSLTEKNVHGFTALQITSKCLDSHYIFPYHQITEKNALLATILKHIDDVGAVCDENGESFVDGFLNNDQFRDEILKRSNDPLFAFFKKDADLFAPSKNSSMTHVAISHGEGFWSSGLWSWSRLAKAEYSNVKFHLVTLDILQKGGDAFIKQFDGWMSPGGGDDYPHDKEEFTKKDWTSSMTLIHTYQYVLEKVFEFKIPYMGMCAGAQNMVLHSAGALAPVKGYVGGKHTMIYFKGTLPHFMAMTKEQQKLALNKCEFPEIIFNGDTAHSYAGVTYKLGNGVQLGAISESGVAMSYAHENGLGYATQFHPEHHYQLTSNSTNHEKAWLNNFVDLTILHHEAKTGKHEHPEFFFELIAERLDSCMNAPTSLADGKFFDNSTLEIVFFGD